MRPFTYDEHVAIFEAVEAAPKGTPARSVALAKGVAPSTVSRVCRVFRAVRDHEVDKLPESTAVLSRTLIAFAEKYFESKKEIEDDELSEDLTGFLNEICSRLSAISYGITQMNEKLDKLCDLWEGK